MTPTDVLAAHNGFEANREAVVRGFVQSHAYPPDLQTLAIRWLAKLQTQAERLKEASQSEMAAIASRAAIAAERAAVAEEEQARAADKQARTAKHALITAIVATAIAAAALIISTLLAFHVIS